MDLTLDLCTVVLRHAAAQCGLPDVMVRLALVARQWRAAALALAQDDAQWEAASNRTVPAPGFSHSRDLQARGWHKLAAMLKRDDEPPIEEEEPSLQDHSPSSADANRNPFAQPAPDGGSGKPAVGDSCASRVKPQSSAAMCAAPPAAPSGPEAEAMRRAAGFNAAPQADQQRATLSRALASNMNASLLSSADDSLGIDATISQSQSERKADFEATKAAMRAAHAGL